ncbi:CRISP/Allergen/PR-1-like [Ornithodoros turicata]|uniref:CRISP/Allergen/PR-1-like n=1 Tax=Ornithodoros turicata TaxID=34597 RepID=UPI003138D834
MLRPVGGVLLLVIATIGTWLSVTALDSCEVLTTHFTKWHTLCLPKNASCKILAKDVDVKSKLLILDIHNKLRSTIANGEQAGLPSAANMMELEWDDDLAAVAQAHAEQCVSKHDCAECRALVKYPYVGQNIYKIYMSGWSHVPRPNWQHAINAWYAEVSKFKNDSIAPFRFTYATGHFSQVAWATTSKVGCGFVCFAGAKPDSYSILCTCNYAPGGNLVGGSMYLQGEPCSKCPEGTCCGKDCDGDATNYEGLCRTKTVRRVARQVTPKSNPLLQCRFDDPSTQPCRWRDNPPHSFYESADGFLYTAARPGQQVEVDFDPVDYVQGLPICVLVKFQKGALNEMDTGHSELYLRATSLMDPNDSRLAPIHSETQATVTIYEPLIVPYPTKIGVVFVVPGFASEQYLKLYEFAVYEGGCGAMTQKVKDAAGNQKW